MWLSGTAHDLTSPAASPIAVDYRPSDLVDVAMETLIFTASADRSVVFSNNAAQQRWLEEVLEVERAEDVWGDMLESGDWASYRPPARESFWSSDPEAIATELGLSDEVAAALPNGENYRLETLTRTNPSGATHVTKLSPIFSDHEIVQQPPDLILHRHGDAAWRVAELPLRWADTRLTDVVPIGDSAGRRVLIVTDREGLFMSNDGGATWQQANAGEEAFVGAEAVKVVVVGSEPVVYVLVIANTEPDDGINPLYRHQERDWLHRWRLGLASLLGAD